MAIQTCVISLLSIFRAGCSNYLLLDFNAFHRLYEDLSRDLTSWYCIADKVDVGRNMSNLPFTAPNQTRTEAIS